MTTPTLSDSIGVVAAQRHGTPRVDPRSPRSHSPVGAEISELRVSETRIGDSWHAPPAAPAADAESSVSCGWWCCFSRPKLTVNQRAMQQLQNENKVDEKTFYLLINGRVVAQGETMRHAFEAAGDATEGHDNNNMQHIDCFRGDVSFGRASTKKKPVARLVQVQSNTAAAQQK